MPEQFLHGVQVVEVNDGPRPVRTVKSAVIGIVGTAPNAQAGASASLSVGLIASNNALTFTAVAEGDAGNNIFINLVRPLENDAALSVVLSELLITVNLATDSGGAVTSTAAEVIAAIEADANISALVGVDNTGASDGSGVVDPLVSTALAGGLDEAFPLNTPVLVAGSRTKAALLDTVGTGEGTLPQAFDDIFDQAGALVIVVRVAEGVDAATTKTNVIGVTAGTGIKALLDAESVLGYEPKILIAPGFSDDQAVATELDIVAGRLRAVVPIEGPSDDYAAAVAYAGNFGSKRLYLVDPAVKVWDTAVNAEAIKPNSARVAGLIAQVDNDLGFWNSPSNKEIKGILGTERAIPFKLGDVNSEANLLNEQNVATIIRQDGYKLWGNRTLSSDPKFAFLSVVRTDDLVADSLQRAHMWAVDKGITKTYVEDVIEGVDNYLRHLKAIGAIIGGRVWADEELNTPASLADGKVYIDYEFTPVAVAETLTFRRHLVNDYYIEVI